MVEAVLCDIDGTLVQSNWLHAEAWQVAFRGMGTELELEDIRRQIGKGGDELIPVFVPWWKRDAIQEPLEAYRKFVFKQDFKHRVEPLPGAHDFLKRVKAAGVKVALSSSASTEDLLDYRKLLDADELVDEATSADDAKKSKPHSDIFDATLRKLRMEAKSCIALGDTPYDAEAAGHAGLRTIGVMTGGWSREELLAAGCVEVYESVAELLQKFDESAIMRETLR